MMSIMGESAVQEHCRQHCFHGIGQDGGTTAAAAGILALAQLQVASQIPLLGHQHQTALADQVGTDAGQVAFGQVGEGAVEVVGHDHAQHGVAQKFQAFVAADAAQVVLVGVGAVGQGMIQQLGILELVSQFGF